MANIQISALLPSGYDLFNDDANFLNDLNTQEIQSIVGGHHSHGYHHHYSQDYSQDYSNSYSNDNSYGGYGRYGC